MSNQQQLFPAGIGAIGILATIGPDGLIHVRSSLRVGCLAPEHRHSSYSMCTDDELQTVLEASVGALFVRAAHLRMVSAFPLDGC